MKGCMKQMSKKWYPIITAKCTKCMACVVACDLGLLSMENNQINNSAPEKCPDECKKCQIMCQQGAIHYFDGTTESILAAFAMNKCNCGCGHSH